MCIIKELIFSREAQLKGCILDLPFYARDQSWARTILNREFVTDSFGFTHVLELNCDDAEVVYRVEGMRANPENNRDYSLYEREFLRKPKPVPEDEDEAPEEEDEEAEKAPNETDIVRRVCDEGSKFD